MSQKEFREVYVIGKKKLIKDRIKKVHRYGFEVSHYIISKASSTYDISEEYEYTYSQALKASLSGGSLTPTTESATAYIQINKHKYVYKKPRKFKNLN